MAAWSASITRATLPWEYGKLCSKGLCRDCAVDLGRGLACAGCVDDASRVIDSIASLGTHRGNTIAHAILLIAIGAILVVTFGLTPFALIGALPIAYGTFILVRTPGQASTDRTDSAGRPPGDS